MPKWALWLHNLMMQDDASVPENQDATSGTLEHALGEAALAAAFDFVEERVCQKIERYGIKLGRRSRKKVRIQLERMLRDETLSSIKVRDWTRWGQHEFTIQFSDQDQQDLAAFESRLIEIVPTILTDSLLSMEVTKRVPIKLCSPKSRGVVGGRGSKNRAGLSGMHCSLWHGFRDSVRLGGCLPAKA